MKYETLADHTWRHTEDGLADDSARMRELVRYATLAPSSHNTQCWKFRVGQGMISILPDFERRCRVVDPDDHHLFVSLGCASENLIQAAAAMGLHAEAFSNLSLGGAVDIRFAPALPKASPLFRAIPVRQSTRGQYDGRTLSTGELELLKAAGTGDGIGCLLITDRQIIERVLDFVVEGNTAQLRDPAFIGELKNWIRFSASEAVRTGDGLSGTSSGNPSIPSWLGRLIFRLVVKERAENDKYAKHVRSSAGIAVFVSETDDKAHWIEAGRAFERFALQAAALEIRNAHLNQPVEVESIRPEFARFLGLTGRRPDLVIRFGRGPLMPRSLRRPVDAVIVQMIRLIMTKFPMLVVKSIAAWLVILALAMANGVFRESVLRPNLSMPVAYLASGILLSLLIIIAARVLIRRINPKTARRCIMIGAFWLLLTLLFEFGFGALQGKSWAEMTEAYLFREGNIWPVVLLVTFFSPLIAFRLRFKGKPDVDGNA